jgi:hypothetical protein
MCRDSYAAGMGDPLVTYAATQAQPEPVIAALEEINKRIDKKLETFLKDESFSPELEELAEKAIAKLEAVLVDPHAALRALKQAQPETIIKHFGTIHEENGKLMFTDFSVDGCGTTDDSQTATAKAVIKRIEVSLKQSHPDDSKIRVGDKVRIGVYVCGEFKPMGLAIVVEDVDAQLCKVDKMSLHGGAPWITLEQKSHLRKEPKAQPEPVIAALEEINKRIDKNLEGFHNEWAVSPELECLVEKAIAKLKSEPVDTHTTLRAEYAKQVKEGTTGFYLWEYSYPDEPNHKNTTQIPGWTKSHVYYCTDISCYVSKDGEPAIRMLRTKAQELQCKTKDTHDWFDPAEIAGVVIMAFDGKGTYTYTPKSLKQPTWTSSRDDVIALLKEMGLL